MLYSLLLLYIQVEDYQNILKLDIFFKKFPYFIFCMIFEKTYFSGYILLIAFISWDIG